MVMDDGASQTVTGVTPIGESQAPEVITFVVTHARTCWTVPPRGPTGTATDPCGELRSNDRYVVPDAGASPTEGIQGSRDTHAPFIHCWIVVGGDWQLTSIVWNV